MFDSIEQLNELRPWKLIDASPWRGVGTGLKAWERWMIK